MVYSLPMVRISAKVLMLGLAAASLATASADEPTEITAIDSIARGAVVSIRGQIIEQPDYDEIVVEDATGRVEVYAPDGFRRTAFDVGDTVTVVGRVDDDLLALRREIYADVILLPDGSRYVINDPIFLYCDEGIE